MLEVLLKLTKAEAVSFRTALCLVLPVVLQVRENIVHEARNERNSFVLLIAAVHHVQKWCQDLVSEKMC